MRIPLDEFEDYINETILERGLSYFESGYVHDPEEISHGEYEAIVEGSEDYTVRLTVKDGIVTDHSCDCPYDMGPICKHVVAVLFYLQNEGPSSEETEQANTRQAPTSAKHKTVAQQVDELLEKVTHEELKQFVRENVVAQSTFRNLFLASFARYNSNDSKELYVKQIDSFLRAASERDGSLRHSAMGLVSDLIDSLLESAESHIDNRNYKSAVFICTAVMEEVTKALEYSDDSDGDMSEKIDLAYEMLCRVAEEQTSEEIRKLIIEYCFSAFAKKVYSGWDWHIGLLRLAADLLKTEEETQRILAQIDKAQRSDYEKEEAQSIKYEILLKTKGENAADEYLEQNITNSNLRRKALQKALEKKDYEKAISIATDGINCGQEGKSRVTKEWYDWLLTIAQAQNDTEKIIEYARLLFVDNFRHKKDYYQILKQHVEPEKWSAFIEGVVQDIIKTKRWYDTELVAGIFIKEEWWERLLDLVKKSPTLNTIECYEKYLEKDYAREIVELYAGAIMTYVGGTMGREHYKNACGYLRRMIKLGARERANEVISRLRVLYSKRKALMEELDRV